MCIRDSGETDNRTTLLAAIAALPATGGTIFIPTGTFEFTGPLLVEIDYVTFRGEGKASILENIGTGGEDAVVFGNATGGATRSDNCSIRNLTIKGNASSGNGISFTGSMNEFVNLFVHTHGGHGIYAKTSVSYTHLTLPTTPYV